MESQARCAFRACQLWGRKCSRIANIRGSLSHMLYQEDGHAARAAELEERAAVQLDLVRKALRGRLVASGLRFTKVSQDLGHSSTYLSSVLATAPRTELRLKTVLMLLEVLEICPADFFWSVLSRKTQTRSTTERADRFSFESVASAIALILRDASGVANEPEPKPAPERASIPDADDLARVVEEAAKSLTRLASATRSQTTAKAS